MQKQHKFNENILRQYDIRGIVDINLFEEDAYFTALCLGEIGKLKKLKGKACVGADGRITSPKLKNAIVKGFLDAGIDVIDIGTVPTPALYFAAHTLPDVMFGVMVTGSHNPPDYNGFKMVLNKNSVYGDEIRLFEEMARNGITVQDFEGKKTYHGHHNILPQYLDALITLNNLDKANDPEKKLRLAWDPGNGAACVVLPSLTSRIDAQHFIINQEIDGTFPSHHPDPTVPENMKQLIQVVIDNKCDFGIAFDGDGDRLGVVDKLGNILYGDHLLLIFAKDLIGRKPGSKIIADVKTSDCIFEKIEEWGGVPMMWRTGHALIKTKMKDEKAELAGEMSGHLFFAENYYGFDDALFGACKLINILSESPNSLEEIMYELPVMFSTPEIRITCPEEKKLSIMNEIKKFLQNNNVPFNDLDGVRVQSQKGWWLIRHSNTENCLVIRVDGKTRVYAELLLQELQKTLHHAGIDFIYPSF